MERTFARYVAIGDSTTEGLDDPDGRGGYRGWANRLAERLSARQGGLLYANLGIRGRQTREVRDEQLAPALAMQPDLATVVAGTNDLLRPRFDPDAVADEIGSMQQALVEAGAVVLTFTLPELGGINPLARPLGARTRAFNEAVRRATHASGAILLDLAARPVASDPRLWSDDRLHANAVGHARIAEGLAWALDTGATGPSPAWAQALPPLARPGLAARVQAEARWWTRHFLPWMWRHVRGRSSGDGRGPKRPCLAPLAAH